MRPLLWAAPLIVAATASLADGVMLPRHTPKDAWEREYVTEVDQKAAVLFDGQRETLVISPSFQGSASSFAWVVPVPARPVVSIVHGSLFHELSDIAYAHQPHAALAPAGVEEQAASPRRSVTVLERRVVGAYDVSVLDANDGSALRTWLEANGYSVPAAITRPLGWYVAHHWTFVASRIKAPAISHGLATGTLAPIELTFPAARPIYPMRLSSANADPFSLLVYIVKPLQSADLPAADLEQLQGPGLPVFDADPRIEPVYHRPHNPRTPILADLRPDASEQPTLAHLEPGRVAIYLERGTFSPQACTEDFVWAGPSGR